MSEKKTLHYWLLVGDSDELTLMKKKEKTQNKK